MKTSITLLAVLFSAVTSLALADTFGSGANTFDIEFVPIGNPDNLDDTTGDPIPAGKVEYAYRMGKYEISEDMINKANTLGGLGITHENRGANKPVTYITWFEAARFVNWLNTSTGNSPAYKFDNGPNFQLWIPGDAGYDPNNLFRNKLALYVLPSVDEWYKAAYYNPTAGIYYDYPTGSDSVPDGIDFGGDTTSDAVFFDGGSNLQPSNITDVGVLSPYGTAGQGGNVWEWEETEYDLANDSSSSGRGVRGGSWSFGSSELRATFRGDADPTSVSHLFGFRVASIPEPSTLLLTIIAFATLITARRNPSLAQDRV